MALTPSQVKNYMRRGLRLLLDPDLEKQDRQQVIEFFNHECAYCGQPIEDGKGDLDHLVSTSQHGSNHISNRVLSCKRCNAHEKRETDWQVFLRNKCGGETPVFARRRQKIEEWVRLCGDAAILSEATLRVLQNESERVTAEYDEACRRIRKVKQNR